MRFANTNRKRIAALALAVIAAGCVENKSTSGVGARALSPEQIPGVANFAQVTPFLYRGEQPTAEGFAELKRHGIRTVVSLRSFNSDRDSLRGTGLRYIRIGAKPWHPEDEDLIAFLKVVEDAGNHPVFVHCQHGSDRTGYMIAAYRMIEQGWSLDAALHEMERFGFNNVWVSIPPYLRNLDRDAIRAAVATAPPPDVDVVE